MSALDLLWKEEEEEDKKRKRRWRRKRRRQSRIISRSSSSRRRRGGEEEEKCSITNLLKRSDLKHLTSYISFVFVSSFSCCRSVSVVLCVVEKRKKEEEEGKQAKGEEKGLEKYRL